MIDFSKYTLQELQAITEVLDDLTYKMALDYPDSGTIPYRYFRAAVSVEKAMVEEQARDAAEPASVPAPDPPEIKCSNIDPEQAEPAGDPPAEAAAPDMFGWVGDALDDLCAAGEVIGNDR